MQQQEEQKKLQMRLLEESKDEVRPTVDQAAASKMLFGQILSPIDLYQEKAVGSLICRE